MQTPTISVVVPTRNRRGSVTRLLDALARLHAGSPAFDVVVVDDGSTDDTVGSIEAAGWPFTISVAREPGRGAAVARNAGARRASSDVLLFLDDDVEPQDGLIAAHCALHAGEAGVIGLGDLPPVMSGTDFLSVMLRTWWEATQSGMRRPGYRHTYRDLLSGHFSMRRSDFERLGGFDETLGCREDYELGYRALAAGLRFRFLPRAVALHYDATDVRKALQRKVAEGRADAQLLRRHPGIGPSLSLAWTRTHSRLQRPLISLAWRAPGVGNVVSRAVCLLLDPLERIKLRWRWRSLFEALLSYSYWRGVAEVLPGRDDLEKLLRAVPRSGTPPLTIDLARGLEAAERLLDRERPPSIRLISGDALIGIVPVEPGSEPLRGAHLRPLLATRFRAPCLQALRAAGKVPASLVTAAAPGGAEETRDIVAA